MLELNRRDETLMATAAQEAAVSAFSLKKILGPVDFSDCSTKALQYAIPLAKQHQASLILLYVVPTVYAAAEYGMADYAQVQQSMRTEATVKLETLALHEVHGAVPVERQVHVGSPAHEILNVAADAATDLIVISTHGRTGLKHVFMGSVAEEVVRRAPCPVLVVREREREFLAKQ